MPKKTHKQTTVPNQIEAVKSLPSEFGNTVVNESKSGGVDFLKQLLGVDFGASSKNSPDKAVEQPKLANKDTGVVFDIKHHGKSEASKKSSEKQPKPERAAAIDYHRDIVRSSERASKMEVRGMDQKIQQITMELRRLISSSKVLQMEFAQVAVEQNPTNVGEYHVNFFDWMLIVIKNAREKVENSGAWLNSVKGKNGKAHWGKISQKGANTHVTLSNERTVATQTG